MENESGYHIEKYSAFKTDLNFAFPINLRDVPFCINF